VQVGDRPVLLSAICVAAHGLANATASKEWVETRPAAQVRPRPRARPAAGRALQAAPPGFAPPSTPGAGCLVCTFTPRTKWTCPISTG